MEKSFIGGVVLILLVIAFLCFCKINDFEIQRAYYSQKSKYKVYGKLFIQFIFICFCIFSVVLGILIFWR